MGPQASGKGTQAEKIAQQYGLLHFSVGDFLRAEVKKRTELGRKAEKIMDEGGLMEDEIIFGIVKQEVSQHPDGVIFDGFPRTEVQAQMLHEIVPINAVIDIKIHDEIAVKRISSRLVCSKCGEGYNTISQPPKKEGVCDNDGAPLIHRDDDVPEAVRHRLELYHKETEPILAYYRNEGVKVFDINGEQRIDKVFEDIKEAIDSLQV